MESIDGQGLSTGPFWRSRLASEAIGILQILAGILALLALVSYDPRDPNIFSWTAGGEAASPNNWIGGFGASLAAALYALFGLPAWGVSLLVVVLGWRRFWGRAIPNPASKAAGIGLLLLSVPMLFALSLGRRRLYGEEMDTGGLIGRALGEAFRNRIGTTGALESCTICAKRKTASSKRLLKPWMKTRTWRLGVVRRVRWNQASACARSITSAFNVTNSVAGLPGTCCGHCTSPICRAFGGGIETVMLAKPGAGPRSPENISAGSTRLRVVATSMSTRLAPATVPLTGTITPRTLAQALRPDTKARIKGRCAT